jgi:hypothetical protein
MQQWLRDWAIVTTLMVAGALTGVYGGKHIYYKYYGNKEHICIMVQGFSAVVLVNIVIYVYIIINHTEDFKAVFCKDRERWIKHDKEETARLLREEGGAVHTNSHPKKE